MNQESDRKLVLYWGRLGGGGISRVMVTLAEEFSDRGYKVVLLFHDVNNHNAIKIRSSIEMLVLGRPRGIIRKILLLARYFRNNKPEIVLSAGTERNIIAICARALSKVNMYLAITEHDLLSMRFLKSGFRRRQYPKLARIFYRKANAVITVSKGVQEDLSLVTRLPANKIDVIYNPIVDQTLLARSFEAPEHPWLIKNENTFPVILGAGRLSKEKGFSTLIMAFNEVLKKCDARLIIIGEGGERASLCGLAEQLGISDNISIPGFVDNPYAYMRAASVFVLSSEREGLGNVLIEAMACDVPVIATNCPCGPAEILENGKWGKLAPVGDYQALGHEIIRVLDNSNACSRMADRVKSFSVQNVGEQYLSILCDGKRGGDNPPG